MPYDDPARELHVLIAFLNTGAAHSGGDALADVLGFRSWLVRHGLLPADAAVTAADLADATALRDRLRVLLHDRTYTSLAATAARLLNPATTPFALRVEFDPDGEPRLRGVGSAATAVLAACLGTLPLVAGRQQWSRVKVCLDPDCGRVFYDRSRNRVRRWCATTPCANRAKGFARGRFG